MKISYINGLKGICCVLVSVGHMVAFLLPSLYFGEACESHTNIAKYIYESPLNIFFNSSSALMCFLCLSGFVIPLKKFMSAEKISILGKWGEKYLRFMPMSLIGALMGWMVMKFDVVYCYRITDLSYSYTYGASWNNFIPAKLFAKDGPLCDGIIRTFLVNSRYNSPLGTLKFIWIFSLILLLYTKWITDWKYREFVYAISFFASVYVGQKIIYTWFYFAAMILGMWICDMMFNPQRALPLKLSRPWTGAFLIASLILLSIPVGRPSQGCYAWISSIPVNHTLYWILGWGLLIIAVNNSSVLQHFLSNSLFLKLGTYSFSYFVVHWPIVISFSCIVTLALYKCLHLSYVISAIIAILISFLVIVFASVIVQKIYMYILGIEQFIVRKLIEK